MLFMCFWKRHQGFSAPTENMFHKLIGGGSVQLSFLYCSIAAAVSFAIEILYSWCLVVEFQLCRDAVTIQAFVVGHDWGAKIAWDLCLFRPDRVKALVNLGVPYRPRSIEFKPTEFMSKKFGEGFYISQFQELGRAEKSFSTYDCLTVLKKFLLVNGPEHLAAPPGVEIIDFLETPSSLPPWIFEEELQLCANKFQKSGFTGALNYYRVMDLNWELLGPWQGAKITVPTKFIVGDKDVGFHSFGTKDYVEGEEFKTLVPNLKVVIIDGHHYIQQEKAEQVTNEILSFFNDESLA